MKTIKKIMSVLPIVALCVLPGTVLAKPEAKEPNLVQVAQSVNSSGAFAGVFDTVILLASSDPEIAEVLTSKGQHTVFAPTDGAFEGLLAAVEANCIDLTPETVNAVLKYHIVQGRRDSEDIVNSYQIRSLLGAFFTQSGGFITDNAGQMAEIIATDVEASNGIIHAIDTVILPFPVENMCEAM